MLNKFTGGSGQREKRVDDQKWLTQGGKWPVADTCCHQQTLLLHSNLLSTVLRHSTTSEIMPTSLISGRGSLFAQPKEPSPYAWCPSRSTLPLVAHPSSCADHSAFPRPAAHPVTRVSGPKAWMWNWGVEVLKCWLNVLMVMLPNCEEQVSSDRDLFELQKRSKKLINKIKTKVMAI